MWQDGGRKKHPVFLAPESKALTLCDNALAQLTMMPCLLLLVLAEHSFSKVSPDCYFFLKPLTLSVLFPILLVLTPVRLYPLLKTLWVLEQFNFLTHDTKISSCIRGPL
jgi:hypothetical protein